jgi:DNA gyrase subunit B
VLFMEAEGYGPERIKVLKGLDPVRYRPGMYIGDTGDGSGLHNMVYEAADNSIAEARTGYAGLVSVVLNRDGSVAVEDNGRGIPTEIHPPMGVSAAEVIMTQLHAGGTSGLAVVNALSARLELTIWRGGQEHFMAFADGVPEAPLKAVKSTPGKTGTRVTITPSPEIFSKVEFDYAALEQGLRELAFLNSGVNLVLSDLRGTAPVRSEFNEFKK